MYGRLEPDGLDASLDKEALGDEEAPPTLPSDLHGATKLLERAEVVRALFELADADRDGLVSWTALRLLLTLLDLPADELLSTCIYFAACDAVDVEQFAALIADHPIPAELSARWARTLASAVAEVDEDLSGELDAKELRHALRRVGVILNDAEFGEFFSYVDADGDGTVSALELACALPPARPDGSRRFPLRAAGASVRVVPALLQACSGSGGFDPRDGAHAWLFDLSHATILPSWACTEPDGADGEEAPAAGAGAGAEAAAAAAAAGGIAGTQPEDGCAQAARSAISRQQWRAAKRSAVAQQMPPPAARPGGHGNPRTSTQRKGGGLSDRQAQALQHLPPAERIAAQIILQLDRSAQPAAARAAVRARHDLGRHAASPADLATTRPMKAMPGARAVHPAPRGQDEPPFMLRQSSARAFAAALASAEACAASAASEAASASASASGAVSASAAKRGAIASRAAADARSSAHPSSAPPRRPHAALSPSTLLAATWPVRRRAVCLAFLAGCCASSLSTFSATIAEAALRAGHRTDADGGVLGGAAAGANGTLAPPSPPSVLSRDQSHRHARAGTAAAAALTDEAAAASRAHAHALLDERASSVTSDVAAAAASTVGTTRHARARFALECALMTVGSIAEVLCLYALALGAVMQLTHVVGLTLTPVDAERAFVISALARAALQLGNPTLPDARYRIDPLRRASRLRLCVAALLWKGKSMLATSLVKLFLKRILARTASEQLLEWATVPVIGLCDAAVLHIALLDCLAVAQAPLLTARVLDSLVLRFGTARVTPFVRLALFRAIGCAVVRIEAHHPACSLLLTHLERLVGRPEKADELDDESLLLAQLPGLHARAQQLTLRLLFVALATDGLLNPLERQLVLKGARLCPQIDFERSEVAVDAAANAIVDGRSLDVEATLRLFPLVGERSDGDGGGGGAGFEPTSCAGICARSVRVTVRGAVRTARRVFKVIC